MPWSVIGPPQQTWTEPSGSATKLHLIIWISVLPTAKLGSLTQKPLAVVKLRSTKGNTLETWRIRGFTSHESFMKPSRPVLDPRLLYTVYRITRWPCFGWETLFAHLAAPVFHLNLLNNHRSPSSLMLTYPEKVRSEILAEYPCFSRIF